MAKRIETINPFYQITVRPCRTTQWSPAGVVVTVGCKADGLAISVFLETENALPFASTIDMLSRTRIGRNKIRRGSFYSIETFGLQAGVGVETSDSERSICVVVTPEESRRLARQIRAMATVK